MTTAGTIVPKAQPISNGMENNIERRNYELAFHIKQSLQESEAVRIKDELENLVRSGGGVVSFSRTPEKTRLSYPIGHERASYFGYIQFSLENSEALEIFNEPLKLNTNIIRYILIATETEEDKRKALAKKKKDRGSRKEQVVHTRTEQPQESTKELERQIEEIIGDL